MQGKYWLMAILMMFVSAGHAGPAEAKAAYMRGAALEKSKEYAAAIKEYQAALAADPRYAYAHKQMGNCYYYSGDKARALQHYDAYLAAMPNDSVTKKFADGLRGSDGDSGGSAKKRNASSTGPDNLIYTNALSDAVGCFNLGYNRAFGDNNALVLEGAVWGVSAGSASVSLVGAGLGWHFTGDKLKGWYIGPKVTYFNFDEKVTFGGVAGSFKGTITGFGGEAGYQWLWDSGFMLNVLVGGAQVSMASDGVTLTSGSGTSTNSGVWTISGFIPSGGLNLGFAF